MAAALRASLLWLIGTFEAFSCCCCIKGWNVALQLSLRLAAMGLGSPGAGVWPLCV
jgi:hypothetical protein